VGGHRACAGSNFQDPLTGWVLPDKARQGMSQEAPAGHDRAGGVKVLSELSPKDTVVVEQPRHGSVVSLAEPDLKRICPLFACRGRGLPEGRLIR